MKREPFAAGPFVAVGYSPCASVLEVEFAGGTVRQYLDVPTSAFDGMLAAPSPGRYFLEHIEGRFSSRECAAPATAGEAGR